MIDVKSTNESMKERQKVSCIYTSGQLIDYTKNQLCAQSSAIEMRIRGIPVIGYTDMSIDALLYYVSDEEKLEFSKSLIETFDHLTEGISRDCDPLKLSIVVVSTLEQLINEGYDIAATYSAILVRIFASVGCIRVENG